MGFPVVFVVFPVRLIITRYLLLGNTVVQNKFAIFSDGATNGNGMAKQKQTATLIKGKPLEYSGKLYSEEHNCKFTVERVTVQITPDPTDKRKLQLNIDKVPFKEWCRKKFERLRNTFCQSIQRQQKYKGLKC